MTLYSPEFSESEQSKIDAEFSRLTGKWGTRRSIQNNIVKYTTKIDNKGHD